MFACATRSASVHARTLRTPARLFSRAYASGLSASLRPASSPAHARPHLPAHLPSRLSPCASRPIATSAPASSTSTPVSDDAVPDPSRADLFYHPTPPAHPGGPRRFALSFLPALPPAARARAPAVLGWLPAEAPGGGSGAGLNDFVENPRFRDALQAAIGAALDAGADEIWANGALQAGEGWMHIHDERNPPPLGRIGDPDDILGSVRVEGGQIVRGTYQPMPSYRLATADGVTHLTPGLAKYLCEALEADLRGAA